MRDPSSGGGARGGEEVVDWVDSRSARMGLEGMHRGYEEEKGDERILKVVLHVAGAPWWRCLRRRKLCRAFSVSESWGERRRGEEERRKENERRRGRKSWVGLKCLIQRLGIKGRKEIK